MANETLLLDNNGSYRTFDVNGKALPQQKPQLTLLLQVLTNENALLLTKRLELKQSLGLAIAFIAETGSISAHEFGM